VHHLFAQNAREGNRELGSSGRRQSHRLTTLQPFGTGQPQCAAPAYCPQSTVLYRAGVVAGTPPHDHVL